MKLQTLAGQLTPLIPRLRCPQCGAPLTLLENRSLLCERRHCFDLCAKGYVNLAPGHDQKADKYDAALFESRSRVFAGGFYTHVAQTICEAMARAFATRVAVTGGTTAPFIVDVGCGEGYYARMLAQSPLHPLVAGVDLSRDAIVAAARQAPALNWLVADLTRLPFADHSVDGLLDVLTPADYREFTRVLSPGGLLIKVIPADDYLIEIRRALADRLQNADFSNARVLAHLREHANVTAQIPVRRTLPVTPEQAQDFLRMTPMTFGLMPAQLTGIPLTEITVAMEVLVCRPLAG